MLSSSSRLGSTGLVAQALALIICIYLSVLSGLGLIPRPFSSIVIILARGAFLMLPASLLLGIGGVLFDEERTKAVIVMALIIPMFLVMLAIAR